MGMNKEDQKKLEEIRQAIKEGFYQADWNSLCRWQAPAWFREAKFGIFIHWGLYSIPAHANEWYSRNMYIKGREEFAVYC